MTIRHPSIPRLLLTIVFASHFLFAVAFIPSSWNLLHKNASTLQSSSKIHLGLFSMGDSKKNISKDMEAKKAIDSVVNALRKDKVAQSELGNLLQVTNILGFGSPTPGKLAVRFNASFQKNGKGLSLKPMSFRPPSPNPSEGGRGVMVGQVKASVDAVNGRVLECTVFRDLGYGRSFNLNIPR